MEVRLQRFGMLLLAVLSAGRVGSMPRQAALQSKVEAVIAKSPTVVRGQLGFKFIDAETGEVLAEQNAANFFTPASNTKLYTTATALVRLGSDYRFRTQLRTADEWKPGQDTISNLQIVGGGDPNLSARALPYQVDAVERDPLAALKELADQLAGAGIRKITGDVTGVASRYGLETYPDGWTLDDSVYSYGAPVTALSVNDNTAAIIVRPSEAGELADLEIQPATSHFILLNRVTTDASAESHIHITRTPQSNELVLTGTIGQAVSQWREDVAIDDGALFAARAFIDVLRERGVTVGGEARADYEPAGAASANGTLVAEKVSDPLSEVLRVVNKVSQNLHAEMLLREIAWIRTGTGSLENGRKERELFLKEAGISRDGTGYALDDGSGLARQDLTTPDSTTALLRYMWGCTERETWVNTLPIGGWDGSLQHRFRRITGAQRVRAKTGSLSHVNALSGYIETKDHRWLAFSVMVNGTTGREKDVRDFIDRVCAVFLAL